MEQVQIGRENYFKISNSDELRPFFMSIVSDSDHWMFISSNGGLTAGRKNSEFSIFPYYSDDKITESTEITGSKTIFWVDAKGKSKLWEPFSERYEGLYRVSRNLYKSVYGNKILFEEINHDLELTFRYEWNSSDTYGFIRKSTLANTGEEEVKISMLDGVQNVLPYGVGSDLQNRQSNLVDAYKRSELIKDSGLGIYALSAIIVDKAEPSEALKANIAWSLGLEHPTHLLSSLQLKKFRKGDSVQEETDLKAEKGAYLLHTQLLLAPQTEKEWMMVLNVSQNHSSIINISKKLKNAEALKNEVEKDIELGTQSLISLTAASDGLQYTTDVLRDTRHFSNTLFNIMRGGIFDNAYTIEKWDFTNYLKNANKKVFVNAKTLLASLPETFQLSDLKKVSDQGKDNDLVRLCLEYMPLKFSRRHGDPSRPWNRFSINMRNEDGSKILDYEGNWRDIFQNWEALAHSYPEFIESMIHKFLNATTFDGYNPYRVTKDGFDWEIIEPDDPWSYIGYWGDHQIIYLLKFLEFAEDHYPGKLRAYFDQDLFVYANVPYRIKEFTEILKNPKDTIDFDHDSDKNIREQRENIGADGALLVDQTGSIHRVNFLEKILATTLSKLSNLVPEGGIWMNTQRPEWNDANNALVGNGVSMVTLYYLRRFLTFFQKTLSNSPQENIKISVEMHSFFEGVLNTLISHRQTLSGAVSDQDRFKIVAGLGKAGSDYRMGIYGQTFTGKKKELSLKHIQELIEVGLEYLEHSTRANKRSDGMYHAYNLMSPEDGNAISIAHLSEMLEGQVAVLSSGYLSPEETLKVLDALKSSKLFRPDQYSYLLYPNKDLAPFMRKNTIPGDAVKQSALLTALVEEGNTQIVEKDGNGIFHFNGDFKNAADLESALDAISNTKYQKLVERDKDLALNVFEEVFNHKAFTGRSGTFYGYEGLGSIYWHMVSKLQLAVSECVFSAVDAGSSEEIIGRLLEHYYEINEGIGVHKSPELYGAFPTDPYSHTPAGKGAQQPGMTGQVKEDILSRFGELGIVMQDGKLGFNPCMLRKSEFLQESKTVQYIDVFGKEKQLLLDEGSLCFTYCQVPVVYKLAAAESIVIMNKDGNQSVHEKLFLDAPYSQKLFLRTGDIAQISVNLTENRLR
ncbi:hypothetical protein [Flagellimonas flava]|nr:hypothetical protein [Allomuricauda flava]